MFNDIIFNKYPVFCTYFTDCSKTGGYVDAAVFIDNIKLNLSWRNDYNPSLYAIFKLLFMSV